jgi:predicted regulator of Ras-like GTPase activity (Roadblock/LC7/MglB family)
MIKSLGKGDLAFIFHRGKRENIYLRRVTNRFLLVHVFGKGVSLGLLRLRTAKAVNRIRKILDA